MKQEVTAQEISDLVSDLLGDIRERDEEIQKLKGELSKVYEIIGERATSIADLKRRFLDAKEKIQAQEEVIKENQSRKDRLLEENQALHQEVKYLRGLLNDQLVSRIFFDVFGNPHQK